MKRSKELYFKALKINLSCGFIHMSGKGSVSQASFSRESLPRVGGCAEKRLVRPSQTPTPRNKTRVVPLPCVPTGMSEGIARTAEDAIQSPLRAGKPAAGTIPLQLPGVQADSL